jgi:deazaflavin-dependent oxidoreductase (nitroreductase family)
MKHQIVRALQKYVLNPPIKFLFAMGIVPPGYALLETTGRTTGKARRTPVGDARVGNKFWIVAEHGMKAGYVRNIAHNPRVRLKLREGLRARWLPRPPDHEFSCRCDPELSILARRQDPGRHAYPHRIRHRAPARYRIFAAMTHC